MAYPTPGSRVRAGQRPCWCGGLPGSLHLKGQQFGCKVVGPTLDSSAAMPSFHRPLASSTLCSTSIAAGSQASTHKHALNLKAAQRHDSMLSREAPLALCVGMRHEQALLGIALILLVHRIDGGLHEHQDVQVVEKVLQKPCCSG